MPKWEVSLMVIQYEDGKKYKVTRRFPEQFIAETRIFANEKDARRQFDEWLNQ